MFIEGIDKIEWKFGNRIVAWLLGRAVVAVIGVRDVFPRAEEGLTKV